MRRLLLLPVLLVAPLLVAAPAPAATPNLVVTVVESGLDIPWDLAFLPDGSMLYTERGSRRLSLRTAGGTTRTIFAGRPSMWANGETGLMSVELAADFATSGDFFTCHGFAGTTARDVRVVRWHLDSARTSASLVRTLVPGLPTSGGRHGGCALLAGPGNVLYIGTGDAATGRNPQRLTSGGGKVLRVSATTGQGLSTNRWAASANAMKRRVYTYGHRNVQGLARRADGTIWSVEHGSYRDDEVNRLSRAGNYGWNPVRRTSGDAAYNEGANSPMTDHRLPGTQVDARWRSGNPTVATSGAAFVNGSGWGDWKGALAVTALKDTSLRLLKFSSTGKLTSTWKPPVLNHSTYGRLRGAVVGPDGALYLTTSNGDGNDKILKVTATP